LRRAAGRKLHPFTVRFIDMLVQKKRLTLLLRAATLFRERMDEERGIVRAKVPVLRGLVIEAPDRELVEHLARCAIVRSRPGSEAVFIDVSPEAAVEPNPWLDTAGIFADDPPPGMSSSRRLRRHALVTTHAFDDE
jgi:hypothetical protein